MQKWGRSAGFMEHGGVERRCSAFCRRLGLTQRVGLDALAVLARMHTARGFQPQDRLFGLKHGLSTVGCLPVRWVALGLHAHAGSGPSPRNNS